MRIGIDVRCLMNKNYSGVSRYTLSLLRALFAIDQKNEYLLFYNSSKPVTMPEFNQPNIKYVGFHCPNKFFNLAVNFFNFPKLDKLIGGVDIFFAPNLHFVAWSGRCKKVLAVHDLSFIRFPEFFNFKMRLWHKLILWRDILGQADLILADSESTKNDLMDLLKIKAEKIRVNYLGVGEEFKILNPDDPSLKMAREKYQLPEKFILYLGTLEPRKNIESIIEAYNQLPPLPFIRGGLGRGNNDVDLPPPGRSRAELNARTCSHPSTLAPLASVRLITDPLIKGEEKNAGYDLVIAGGHGWKNKKIFQLAKGNPRIHFIGYIEDRPALYNLASLFVYPSYYEGFGLPLVEAMACGCPVIAGANSSQGEVVGEAGLLVDPYNLNEIKTAMETILNEENFRNNLISRGLTRAAGFTWQKTAEKVLEIFSPFQGGVKRCR